MNKVMHPVLQTHTLWQENSTESNIMPVCVQVVEKGSVLSPTGASYGLEVILY